MEGLAPPPSLVGQRPVVVEGVLSMSAHTHVEVDAIPDCDLHPGRPAYADAKTRGGPWGNLCHECFEHHGCSLGLGRGQELVLRVPRGTADEITQEHEFAEGWDYDPDDHR